MNAEPGYHIGVIAKGILGDSSKIAEEVAEFQDALDQGCALMALNELSDLYGAIEAYLAKHHPTLRMADLARMAEITARAFRNGRRT